MIPASEKQCQFLSIEEPLAMFCGGVGSGKTEAGALWCRDKALSLPGAVGFLGANTYKQLSTVTLKKFGSLLKKHGPAYVYNKQPPASWRIKSHFESHENILTLPNGFQFICMSLENFDAFRGIEVAFWWIDETRDTSEEAFTILLERMRGFDDVFPGLRYEGRITTTPNGFDWLWEKFVNPSTKIPGATYVTASSFDNPFLPPDYAHTLETRFSKQLARQQIYAEFLSLSAGRAFEFSRERNCADVKYDPSLPLMLTMDFNVAPLCAVVMQIQRSRGKEPGRAVALEEIYIPDNGQTREGCNVFVERWRVGGSHGLKAPPLVEFYGDVAGEHRDTRGNISDIAIMQKTLDEGFHQKTKNVTGPKGKVKNGINAVNAMLCPARGLPRLVIHPDKCPMLMRDLEQVSWKPGTTELDKSNGLLTHMADALRYPIQEFFPVREEHYADLGRAGEIGFHG